MVNYTRMLNLYSLPLRKRYRSHFEIIARVLEATKDNGTARFSIMKYADINSMQLRKYLQSLTEIGFIDINIKEGRVVYRASERGLQFLRQYYVLLGMLLGLHSLNESTSIVYEAEQYAPSRRQQPTTQILTHLKRTP